MNLVIRRESLYHEDGLVELPGDGWRVVGTYPQDAYSGHATVVVFARDATPEDVEQYHQAAERAEASRREMVAEMFPKRDKPKRWGGR